MSQTRPIDARRKSTFFRVLSETANVTLACRTAGVGKTTVYRHRETDAKFRARWDEALAEAIDRLEAEAYRIAMEGVTERTYDANGKLVSSRTREDPRLLQFLLSAHKPALYSERQRLEIAGRVTHELDMPSEVVTLQDIIEMQRRRELEPGDDAGEIVDETDEEESP